MAASDAVVGAGVPGNVAVMADSGESGTGFTAETAAGVLAVACADAGLSAVGASMMRLGENAVFRLADPVVVRIGRSADRLDEAQRTVGVARWLTETDYPAVRLVPGVRQPAVVDGRVVTFWRLVAAEERYADVVQFAELMRRLHWLEEPPSLGLPYVDPLGPTLRRLGELGHLAEDDREFLRQRAESLGKRYDGLEFVLPFGMIHGDANVGNALLDESGRAVLIDLDGFELGPREWDLTLTAMYYERYGWHTRTEYESFVRAYGFDVMNWYGYPVLADIRELSMVVWLAQNADHDARAETELQRRISDLRTGGDRHGWQPF
ncbi:aminoglycoside phosphotransferase family protein [Yinghuangia aomiensis]|uniref:Aminoglycoside phosphotransferase family protein n=2 Tax=Yinghuangia aomiensis TaxID=676205 RepID=A0ABP9I0B8_9ACTN